VGVAVSVATKDRETTEEGQPFGNRPSSISRTTVGSDRI